MNKLIIFFISLFLIILGFILVYYTTVYDNSKIDENITTNTNENSLNEINIPLEENKEEVSSFSTKIFNTDTNRQNNVKITCESLDGTTIPSGETFSFTDTLGPATTEKGYLESDIFDSDGNKIKGLRWRNMPS